MPYAFFYDVPGDERIYRRVRSEIGEDRPEGLLLHLVVKRADGLRHINVWQTQQQWERYQRERVLPAVDRVLARNGIAPPPPPATEEMDLVDIAGSTAWPAEHDVG
ncbi:MAG TPA: hypothetical protein VHK89_09995 [Actinomycetota bacterium]|nr:hypothetical protein [Actinomycetota bacterium]